MTVPHPSEQQKEPLRLNSDGFNFASIWVGTFILSFVMISPIFEILRFFWGGLIAAPQYVTLGLVVVIVGFLSSIGQHLSLRYATNKWFTRWWQFSFIGWLIGAALAVPVSAIANSVADTWFLTIQTIAVILPVSVMQFMVLRRYVYDAWLWSFASLAGAALAAPLFYTFSGAIAGIYAFAIYSIVTAVVMFRLLQTTAYGKRKRKGDDVILDDATSRLQDVNVDDIARNQQRHDEKRNGNVMHRW